MSPSVRAHRTTRIPLDGFSCNLIFEDFSKICHENSSFIKLDKDNGYFTWRPIYIFIISRSFLLIMRNVSYKSCTENQNTYFVFRNFFSETALFMRKCGKIMYSMPGHGHGWQYGACALHATNTHTHTHTHTHSLWNTHSFSTAIMFVRTHLNVTKYVHCLSCHLHTNSIPCRLSTQDFHIYKDKH
jgi:hypothetical protein